MSAINGVSVIDFVKLAISRQFPWPVVLPHLIKTLQLQSITNTPYLIPNELRYISS